MQKVSQLILRRGLLIRKVVRNLVSCSKHLNRRFARAFFRLILVTGFTLSGLLVSPAAVAEGVLASSKILQSSPTPFAGDFVEYRLEFSCSGITGDCGGLDILDTLPPELEIVSCLAPPGFMVNSCVAGTNEIDISKMTALGDGEAFTITLRTRVRLDAPTGPTPIVNTADVTIVDGLGGMPQTQNPAADPITIEPGTPRYEVRKVRNAPAPPLEPAPDTDIVYTVEYCVADGIGNVDVNNPTLVDTLPAGAVIVDSGGGTVVGDEISWTLDDFDLAAAYETPADTSEEFCQSRTYVINYPSATFPEGSAIDNIVVAAGDPENGTLFPNPGDDEASINETTGAPNPGAGMGKSAADVAAGAGNGPMVWSLNANIDTSNVPVLELVVYEEIPQTPVEIFPLEVTSGLWNSPLNSQGQSDVQATIQYTNTAVATATNAGTTLDPLAPTDCSAIADANWTTVSGGQIASPATAATYALPADASCVRWVFVDASANAAAPAVPRDWRFTSPPRLSIDTQAVPGPYPVAVDNCMYSYFDADGTTGGDPTVDGPTCGVANIESPTPALDAHKTRVTPVGDLAAGQQFIQRLAFSHIEGDSTGPTVDPIYADLLPPEIQFVRWNSYAGNPPEPVMEVIEDYNGTGRTMVRFSWSTSAPAGSENLDGSDATGINNAASFAETLIADQMPQMDLVLQVTPGTTAGTYTNNADLFDHSPIPATCLETRNESNAGTGGTPVDLNDDGDTTDDFCVGTDAVSVIQAAVLGGKKFVQGSGNPALPNVDDPTSDPVVVDSSCEGVPNGLTRFPCVAQTGRTAPGNTFNYELELVNNGNVLLEDYYLYDVLPHVGDTGTGPALASIARQSTWNPIIDGDITPIAGTFVDSLGNPLSLAAYTSGPFVEYSTAATPCRNELEGDFADPWPAACDNTYVDFASIPGGDLSAVTAFRIRMPFDLQAWPGGASVRFNVPMAAPEGSPPSIAGDASLFNPAWNSFSHRSREDDALPGPGGQAIPTSEPRKVGIILEPHYRIGNLIWLDANNNGIAEAGEPGIAGVDVQIWEDTDGDGLPSAGDTLINTTTTDADGKYLFDNLTPGDFYVMVPDGQNDPGDPLDELFQSTHGEEALPNDDGDNNDNGVNEGVTSGAGADLTTGLASGIITLGAGGVFAQSEPTDETLRSDDATDDDDDPFPDTLSNVSIDIGYYRPFNLGNRVWLDNGDDGTGTLDSAIANNGLKDPGENGIDGIAVTLLNADNSIYDSDPDTAGIQALTTTTANGGYYLFEDIPAGDYRVQLDLSGGNEHLKSSTGANGNATTGPFEPAPDPDNDIDTVDDGTQTTPTLVTSGIVTLGAADAPAEPTAEVDVDVTLTNPQGDDPAGDPMSDNQANMTVDFGLFESYSIGNRVWIEDDNNGIFDAGEAPTDGVGVRLFEDFNDDGIPDGPAIATTTTASGGHYRFDNLLGGTYIVEADIPAGTRSSEVDHGDPDNDIDSDDNGFVVDAGAGTVRSLPVTVGSVGPVEPLGDAETGPGDDGSGATAAPDGHSNLTVDFGFVREYSIGSYVWDDINGDGIQDAGELPIEGALVELVDAAGNPVTDMDGNPVTPQTTGPDGLYFFETLPSDSYRVRVTPPVQYAPSPTQTTADNDDTANDSNIASEFAVGVYESGLFTLASGIEPSEAGGLAGDAQDDDADGHGNMTIDFGFYEPLTLGNLVWVDTDNDGLFNNGETGVDGVSVQLYRDTNGDGVLDTASDELVATTTTAGGGFYQFDDLIADDYFVFIPDSNTAPGGPLEQLVSSTGAGNAFEPAPDPDTNTDNDDSGTRDVPNGGFASQAVTLSANSEPGSEDPTLSGTPGFDGTLVNGQPHDDADSNLTVDFGFTPSMTLGSVVFQDNDDNGVQDTTDPGIENATVQLFDDAGNEIPVGPDGILGTADDAPGGVTSNATGEYNFSGLASGNYVVRVTPPAAYAPSADQIADPNTDINLDSNIDTGRAPPAGSYESGVVTLTPTTEPSGALENDPDGVVEVDPSGTQDNNANLTIDFGFVLPVSIGSYIWEDSNINGIQDPGESAIVAATVELLDENGDPVTDLAGNLVAAVPSSATGEYFFDNLPPGQYKVRVTPLDPSFVPSPAQTAAGDVDTENDSNINGAAIVPAGTFESGVFTLTPGSEPIEGAGVGDDQDDAAIAADDAGNMTVDFGFYRPVSLGSTLWEDTNASGTQDAGEPAIVAAEVTLLNADGTLYDSDPVAPGIQSLTDITDADGQYNFNAIPEGDYRVQVDLSTATNANAAVLVATPAQVADPDAVGPGQDNNTDSNIDTGAPGHNPAAQIYQSGVVTLAAGTEPSGETDPIGAGGADQPNQGLVPANQPDSSGNMTVDFGFIEGVSLGSTVWLDSNADGTQDAAEPAIVGATVTLLNADGTVYDSDPVAPGIQAVTDTTDAEGQYNFNGIPEGDYRVQVDLSTTTSQPAGSLIPTASQVADPDAAGDDNTDTNIDVAFDTDTSDDIYTSGVVSLSIGGEPVGETDPIGAGGADQPGQSAAQPDANGNMTVDFGFFPVGSIGDLVFIDIDGDGVLDPGDGDAGIGGVTVTLDYVDLNGNPVTLTTTTALDGSYLFENLPGNTDYTVTVDTSTLPGTLGDDIRQSYDPDGTLDSTSMLTLDLNGAGTEVVDDLDQDFGYLPLGTIGDTIWYDTNNDGVQDAGELGIAGVTVQLTPPADVNLGAGLGQPVTMVTDSDGHYLFENLPVGAYQVDVISGLAPEFIQSGDPDGTLDNHSDVTLALNPSDPTEVIGNLDQDFGYVEPVSIGGYLWEDLDGDGLQEANEPAIAGSSVTLLMDDGTGTFIPAVDFDGNPVAPITVGQTGQYLFDNLPNGDFKVRVTKPAGLLPTPVQNAADNDDAEDDSNSASEPIVDTFESGVFTLLGGTEPVETNTFSGDDQDDAATAVARDESGNMTVDFGFVPLASIGNRVWLDLDKDGVQDANEDGIAGVTVTLFEDTDGDGIPETAVQTAITGPNGEYLFPDLDPGVAYQVFVDSASLPPSLEQTFDEGPTPGVSGPLDHSSDIIVLTPNEEHLTADFGYAPPPGSIGDTIWIDADGDGIQDPGELGIPGLTVNLLDVDGNIIATLVTDEQGKYLFTGLPEGIYGVEVDISTLPPGYTAHPNGDPDVRDGVTTEADNVTTVELLTLPDGSVESNLDADFGYLPPADQNNSIGDTVWLDADANGVQDPGELGIASVTVILLDDTGEPVATTITNDQGEYLFTGVPDGTYTVVVVDSNNVLNGLEQTFDDDGLSSPNQSTVTDLGVGVDTPVEDLDQDFGYTPINNTAPANTGVIGDTIYFDVDGDGTQGGAESGIEGVTVELRDDQGNLIAVAVTDENGHYLFTGLEVSDTGVDYTVTVRTDTLPSDGGDWTNSADPDGGLDSTSQVSLTTADPVDLEQDFGYGGGINSLSGTIWLDENADGFQDESEMLAGVTVQLLDPDTGNIIAHAVTDANGNYEFINLPDGLYTVLVTDDANILAGFEHTDGTTGEDQNSQMDNGTYLVDLDSAGVLDTPVHDVTSDFGYKPTLTTPITLGSFESEALAVGEVKFSWTTQSEVANAGFMIYQKVGDDWSAVNADIIPAVGESLETVAYSYTGHQVQSNEFVLVDVDTRGKQTLHGPFALGERFGAVEKPTLLKSSSSALRSQVKSRADVRKGAAKQRFKSRLDSYLGR